MFDSSIYLFAWGLLVFGHGVENFGGGLKWNVEMDMGKNLSFSNRNNVQMILKLSQS